MTTRMLAGKQVYPIGLGCMNLNHAYGVPPSETEAIRLVHQAIDLGINHLDTAALYGFGANEKLLCKALKAKRDQVFLASKCGMTGVEGVRIIDGRPETIRKTIDENLQRLGVDYLDLYYLHRVDKKVPLEDSYGTLVEILKSGKVGAIGLSEVSAETLAKAHRIHPVAAVQSEYSLWSRNVEIAVLQKCEELGVALVAFSPLARGFLAQGLTDLDALVSGDIRRNMPRFQEPHFSKNKELLSRFCSIAKTQSVTPAQLCLAWLLAKSPCIHPIPGTTQISHLEENVAAADIQLAPSLIEQIDALINHNTVSGARYPSATQAEIDTEEFAQ